MRWLRLMVVLLMLPSIAGAEGVLTPAAGGLSHDSSGNLNVNQATTTAGERNPTSPTASYLVVHQEANLSVISTTAAVTIGGGVVNDTHLMGIQILAPLTGACTVSGFADSSGTAQIFTIPAAAVGFKDFFGAINSAAALVITCSNALDDNLVLALWRPL